MKKLLFLLLFPVQLVFAQTEISLEECQKQARKNYPNLKQSEIYKEISELKTDNIKTNYLPKTSLNGQVTYQSEVTKIDIPIPNIEIPSISKDQYKVYLEFQQNIWDGGLSASQKLLEEASLKTNLSKLEIELYQLTDKVNKAWFSALAAQKNQSILETRKEILEEKIRILESGIKNGVTEATNLDILLAEVLTTDQSITEIKTGFSISLKILTILTGQNINDNVNLQTTNTQLQQSNELNRPELVLFNDRSGLLEIQSDFLNKQRLPKIYGFGQGGIGRPGLNMLSNDFDPYYLVGIGMSWSAFDWKKTTRKKQIIELQKDLIVSQKETFEQNISILSEQQLINIKKLKNLIISDREIIRLREKIAGASASKLKNGTINSAEYITDLNATTIAKLKLETHTIQLEEAIIKYNMILGKSD